MFYVKMRHNYVCNSVPKEGSFTIPPSHTHNPLTPTRRRSLESSDLSLREEKGALSSAAYIAAMIDYQRVTNHCSEHQCRATKMHFKSGTSERNEKRKKKKKKIVWSV